MFTVCSSLLIVIPAMPHLMHPHENTLLDHWSGMRVIGCWVKAVTVLFRSVQHHFHLHLGVPSILQSSILLHSLNDTIFFLAWKLCHNFWATNIMKLIYFTFYLLPLGAQESDIWSNCLDLLSIHKIDKWTCIEYIICYLSTSYFTTRQPLVGLFLFLISGQWRLNIYWNPLGN